MELIACRPRWRTVAPSYYILESHGIKFGEVYASASGHTGYYGATTLLGHFEVEADALQAVETAVTERFREPGDDATKRRGGWGK